MVRASILCVLFSVVFACAAELTPGLAERYAAVPADRKLPVIIVLKDRVDASQVVEYFDKRGQSLEVIHARLGDSLLTRAGESQAAVLSSLTILVNTGMASDVRPFWISNLIAVHLSQAGALLIANMAEVEAMGLDEEVFLNTVESQSSGAPAASGIDAINARGAWSKGFRGEGRLVCTITDGVDAAHPALVNRKRADYNAEAPCGSAGTAMTGIICGVNEAGDTLGSAPQAEWIADNVFCGETRMSDLIAAAQWAADPDEDYETFGDVPDVVAGAWTTNNACRGAGPDGWWEAFDNMELLGPVFILAAGEGDLKSPASRPESFTVGNVDISGETPQVNAASSRGASPCNPLVIKPDLTAPGTSVKATVSQGYAEVTGTAVSAAHAAAVAALIRQANPTLTAKEVKEVLLQSATDLGDPGVDTDFGAGLLNAEAAVNLALVSGNSGQVSVFVRYGGEPVGGAHLVLSGLQDAVTTVSGINGAARFNYLPAGRVYRLRVNRFGYADYIHSDSIRVEQGRIASVYVNLDLGISDDASADRGWLLGAESDDAVDGTWERAKPVGSYDGSKLVQPDSDAGGDGYCFLTGNVGGADDPSAGDVDGGRTTLRSPEFRMMELTNPVLAFSYWYYSEGRGDFFRVQISDDGGENWVNIINTAVSTGGWKHTELDLSDFVQASDRMVLQFVAEDAAPGSVVEAAVDNVAITGDPAIPEPPRDLTLDVQFGIVTITWHSSPGTSEYYVYLADNPDRIVLPEFFYTATTDTMLSVPLDDIPYHEFYFQVTAAP